MILFGAVLIAFPDLVVGTLEAVLGGTLELIVVLLEAILEALRGMTG